DGARPPSVVLGGVVQAAVAGHRFRFRAVSERSGRARTARGASSRANPRGLAAAARTNCLGRAIHLDRVACSAFRRPPRLEQRGTGDPGADPGTAGGRAAATAATTGTEGAPPGTARLR